MWGCQLSPYSPESSKHCENTDAAPRHPPRDNVPSGPRSCAQLHWQQRCIRRCTEQGPIPYRQPCTSTGCSFPSAEHDGLQTRCSSSWQNAGTPDLEQTNAPPSKVKVSAKHQAASRGDGDRTMAPERASQSLYRFPYLQNDTHTFIVNRFESRALRR